MGDHMRSPTRHQGVTVGGKVGVADGVTGVEVGVQEGGIVISVDDGTSVAVTG